MAHHPTDWEDRIEVIDGKITRVLKAFYNKGKHNISIDVYKENEDGKVWVRNAFLSTYGGWVVCFPGLPCNTNPYSYYYDPSPAVEEDWDELEKRSAMGYSNWPSREEKNLCIMYHYEFKYVLKKWQPETNKELIDKLIMWKLHPEVELPLALGFDKLAMNKRFYSLTAANRKKVARFCKDFPEAHFFTLNEIMKCIKYPETDVYVEYLLSTSSWIRDEVTVEGWKYLKRKHLATKEDAYIYHDYLRMLKNSHHDPESDYWKYPGDLYKRHEKLQQEHTRMMEAARLKEEKAHQAREKKRAKNFESIMKRYGKYNKEIDGYSIFMTNDLEVWQKQANELHQCIIAAGYYKKMANGECLIVFIQKDGVPVATAEIRPGKILGQFYANEIDRNNCRPTEEVTAVFNKWFEKVRVKEVI